MRKNSPRKWLHAILDLLPVLILPIFALAVRSDNNFQPIEVEAQDYQIVDFNQNFDIDNFSRTFSFENNTTRTFNYNGYFWQNHVYVLRFTISDLTNYSQNQFRINTGNDSYFQQINIDHNGVYNFYGTSSTTGSTNYIYLLNDYSSSISFTFSKYNIIDLTQMFGSGNEPTLEEFNNYFPNDYYEYTTSKNVLLNVGTTTLSDTDVGSQMVYTLYNATDKYFNFNNVFNFGQIYDWFVLNIFNGNASLIFPVVWNIVLYEFIMDLVFLIYALFMFFIDFCTNLIDRFHVKCSGGK